MSEASQSLLEPRHRWEHRGGEAARVWALAVSLLLHVGTIYFLGGWLASQPLRTREAPFVVSLVSVVPVPVEQDVPRPHVDRAAEMKRLPEMSKETPPEESGAGTPDAPQLDPTPETPVVSEVTEPQRGDTTAVEPEPVRVERRDVAGEISRLLIEQMDTLMQVPRMMSSRPAASEGRMGPAARLGASAGVEGPLGRRALVYLEHPTYPAWAQEAGIEAEMRFRFWVSAAGDVTRILALRKSAHPELESLARRALGRWRFEPLPPGHEREEWGEVPVVWRLERSSQTGE